MSNNEIINELEKVENKYKDKVFATGELNIHEMVKSCKYKIKELQQKNQQLKEYLERYEKIIFNLKEQLEKERKVKSKAIGHINACGGELTKDECRYLLNILDIAKGE